MSINSIRNLVEIAAKVTPQKVALIDSNSKATYSLSEKFIFVNFNFES